MDLAKSISQKCKIKIVGKRSGEKIHEEMISQADSSNTVEFKKYYVILSTDEEITKKYKKIKGIKKYPLGKSYNSNKNKKLILKDLKKLVKDFNA